MQTGGRYRALCMRISVILPTKDRGPDVARTLSALLEQDLPASDYEVVVVDNASRDENAAALRAYLRASRRPPAPRRRFCFCFLRRRPPPPAAAGGRRSISK